MRLWFDGQCLQTASNRRGIGRYTIELIKAIAENHRDVEMLISFNAAMPVEAISAREAVRPWFRLENIHVWHSARDNGEVLDGFTGRRRLSEAALVRHVEALAPDFAVSTSPFEGMFDPAVPLLKQPGSATPIGSIFYDAIPRRFPDRYLYTPNHAAAYARRLEAHRSYDLNLCISEFSRSELLELLGDVPAVTISAGISDIFSQAIAENESVADDAPSVPYILYVGGLDWRKNVGLLPEAFAQLDASLRDSFRMVLAGDYPDAALDEIKQRWQARGLTLSQLVCHRHVSEAELVRLYRGASLLVQPSFMEGFGLTALEAMVCGTPVAATRGGALPEVIGDERLLFDPSSADELATVMTRILTDAPFRAESIKMASRRAQRFTWARSADTSVAALGEHLGTLPVETEKPTRQPRVERLGKTAANINLASTIFALSEPVTEPGRLIVDATSTMQSDRKTGIQRVVNKICHRMFADSTASEPRRILSYCDGPDGWYDARGVVDFPPDKTVAERLRPRPGDRILMLDSSWTFEKGQAPFFLSARLRGAEIITCLYDLVPLRTPAFCDSGMPPAFASWIRLALRFSTGFVCISRAVADEFHALLRAIEYPHPMKIGYWRLGADFADDATTAPAPFGQDAAKAPVFLMVGTLEPRKGYRVALDAFEQLWADGVDARLVIVGKPGWGVEPLLHRIRESSELGGRLVWHKGVDDAALVRLYREADALVAASHAEGFGLPIVEAAHFGKPVIASDIPVFREVAGGVGEAEFFEVGSPAALQQALRRFLERRAAGDVSAEAPRANWPGWAESAAELEAVVVDGDWYAIYEPPEGAAFRPFTDIGAAAMSREIREGDRRFTVKVVEEPAPGQGGDLRIIVAVTNLSGHVWSSTGDETGRFGIRVAARLRASDGAALADSISQSLIPHVLIPGDTAVLAVHISSKAQVGQGMSLDVTVLQEGCGWWAGGVRVPL
ncbi:glycosyl transferase, group 1 [Aurantimonas manganoxydans SI85-9A1]|uniref:Glycosyl transferase, group 1 n=1 Tax=Aurantimonas manganoxydans (strain ATCC BAA-1229 / DSM 21871 / SI85-9A1) TaxID=287752 RepID=Q1YMB6_AURMS|nr:glycosyltransferase family 1 protein [Aurantimonas manganoxydans]EAS51465.1 glycosyl transferase, group 1 [Aurantimonas manganoxydans SI85-9A1]